MAIKQIIREGYISDLDKFLKEFDRDHPDYGDSRKNEIKKFQKIAAERDGVVEKPKTGIWEKF